MVSYSHLDRLTVIGAGNVTEKKIKPATDQLCREQLLDEVCFCDVKPNPAFSLEKIGGVTQRYVQIPPHNAIDHLCDASAICPRTLAVVATPTSLHIPYAHALAPHAGHVAIEKPIAIDPIEATSLREIAERVSPIEHQLHKPETLVLYNDSRRGVIRWHDLGSIEFVIHEASGVGLRDIDNAIYDLGYHGFATLLASLRTAVFEVEIEVLEARHATYRDGPDQPKKFTAAQIRGRFCFDRQQLPFMIRVGKGMPETHKAITLRDRRGVVVRQANLNESGHHSHLRLLRDLLAGGSRLMKIGLHDSLQVVHACADAVDLARKMPEYRFGRWPRWITHPARRMPEAGHWKSGATSMKSSKSRTWAVQTRRFE